jgi:hypothetical protein
MNSWIVPRIKQQFIGLCWYSFGTILFIRPTYGIAGGILNWPITANRINAIRILPVAAAGAPFV